MGMRDKLKFICNILHFYACTVETQMLTNCIILYALILFRSKEWYAFHCSWLVFCGITVMLSKLSAVQFYGASFWTYIHCHLKVGCLHPVACTRSGSGLPLGHKTETCSGYWIKYWNQCCVRRKPWTWYIAMLYQLMCFKKEGTSMACSCVLL
jgi:hypothetical protein